MAFPADHAPYYTQNPVNPFPPPGPPPQHNAIPPTTLTPAPGPPLPGCPPGLEYLTQIDCLLVHQKAHYVEMVLGWEMSNNYIVKNILGQQIFTAREDDSDIILMQFLGPRRPFNIHVFNNFGIEILNISRSARCDSCLFPCCLQKVEIQCPPGVPIGSIVQKWHPVFPKFVILDEAQQEQLMIKGPFCIRGCFSDVVFQVLSPNEKVGVGQISKKWSGVLQEGFTDADHFSVTFPMDLDVKVKAVLLGAVFLIDFMYFEKVKTVKSS